MNGGKSPTTLSGHGVSSPAYDSQESSWIGLLSVVSRPALSFFQKYVTGRARSPALTSEKGAGWFSGGLKQYFVDKETEFLRQLDDMGPAPGLEGPAAEAKVPSTPECQNKAIAFIMGCPCSDDDDSSQSDRESSDEDDDGFDSEGSSDLSSSSDEDDDEASDSESEEASDVERLLNSLCQSQDPYNPRNFTAQLHTSSTLPRTIPASSTPPSSAQSTPNSSPQPASSTSPPCTLDTWDDSTSASEVDEAESFRLWSSFGCSADPYSPLNFQAPLRTRGPIEAAPRVKSRVKKGTQTPPQSPHHKASSPPENRSEEVEERLNKSCSEESCSSSTGRRCARTKKVRFCDDVEEFFASCGEEEEDRRGPWEELARDRCRFLRRCQEVEQSIAYCLQPQHRSVMYHRLTIFYVQKT